jgi:hypothetical protein
VITLLNHDEKKPTPEKMPACTYPGIEINLKEKKGSDAT